MTGTVDEFEALREFQEFPKIHRLFREIVVTEKIDGTNAQVAITDDGQIRAGSRNRWLTPTEDNHGFARWVEEHAEELRALGTGRHFGEWWGGSIQRGYGLKEKRFSLFNVSRWFDDAVRPKCCHVVPVLYAGGFNADAIAETTRALSRAGSRAAPGFMNPEGVVIFHVPSQHLYKWTAGGDGHKGGAPNGIPT